MYSYKKGESEYTSNYEYLELKLDSPKKNKVTMWSILKGVYISLEKASSKTRVASILIPGIFVIAGGIFIYQQFFPDIQQSLLQSTGYYNRGNVAAVDDTYIDISKYISNPENLDLLTTNALSLNILQPDPVSLNYNNIFYISIPSIGLNRLPVQSNVDSSSENAYNAVLNNNLAHFKSTGLPISDVKNNIVIYGHSASPNLNPSRTTPLMAFSFIPELQVGDEIIIEIEGKEYKYKMFSSKIVAPDETSIITGTKGRGTLTLFTCFPLGSNKERYVAVARPV